MGIDVQHIFVKIARDLYVISLIFSISFFLRGSNNIVITSLPIFVKHYFRFSAPEIGILAASMSISMFVSSGIVNTFFGNLRRILVRIFSVVYGIVLPVISISNSLSIWLISSLVGFCAGLIFPNIVSTSSEIEERKRRERAISLYTVALSLSLVIGPYLESIILENYPLRDVFLFFSPFGVIVAVLSFFLKIPTGGKGEISLALLSSPSFALAVINNTSYDVPFAAITTFGGILEISRGISTAFVAISFSVYFLTSFLSRLAITLRPTERVFRLVFLSLLMAMVGLVMISFSRTLPEFMLSMAVLGIPHGLTYPVSLTILSRGFPRESIASANSLFFSVMSIVSVLTPIVIGFIGSIVGIALSFLSLEVLVVSSIVAMAFLTRRS